MRKIVRYPLIAGLAIATALAGTAFALTASDVKCKGCNTKQQLVDKILEVGPPLAHAPDAPTPFPTTTTLTHHTTHTHTHTTRARTL